MARDIIHNAVKNALINDGWIITADPYKLETDDFTVYADLGADWPIAAEKVDGKIVGRGRAERRHRTGLSRAGDASVHRIRGGLIMAKDIIHNAVKNALIKDGWEITADPFVIEYEELQVYADLAAERPIAAERDGRKIAVEIKSFIGKSKVQDLKVVLGQYEIYLWLLDAIEPERRLYLAVGSKAFQQFFNGKAVQLIMRKSRTALLVVDIEQEEIVLWTD